MGSDFLEKTLEQLIFLNRKVVHERGLPAFYKNAERQFRLPSGKIIDIFSFEFVHENSLHCRIYELKKDLLTIDSFLQILNYYNEIFGLLYPSFASIKVEGILVGSGITPDLEGIEEPITDISFYVYRYDFDGLKFEKQEKCSDYTPEELKGYISEKEINFLTRLREMDARKPLTEEEIHKLIPSLNTKE